MCCRCSAQSCPALPKSSMYLPLLPLNGRYLLQVTISSPAANCAVVDRIHVGSDAALSRSARAEAGLLSQPGLVEHYALHTQCIAGQHASSPRCGVCLRNMTSVCDTAAPNLNTCSLI